MKFISINAEGEIILLNLASILYLRSDKAKTLIHLTSGNIIFTDEPIEELARRLARMSDKF